MFSFGYFPGVRLSFADVSEPSVRSIFKGWMKYILHPAFEDDAGKIPKRKHTTLLNKLSIFGE
jgi:hypothetical protein